MNCPKCSSNISDKTLVCPNCKKVLKLVCPICDTVNKTNSCKKCGFTIVNKCHNCGKINQTISGKCSKCGFSTHTSVAISESFIDEFACLTIDFPDLQEIKLVLGSTKLFDKFKQNLDLRISHFARLRGLKRQVIDDTYIIRFNKSESFQASANQAIKAAIALQNLVTEINFKLDKLKNATIQCKIAVLKRDIYSKPDEYKSGFNIRLLYQNAKKFKLLNSLQIITDTNVYEAVRDNFVLSSSNASFVKNQMVIFFELNLKKYIEIPQETVVEDLDEAFTELPTFDDEIENELMEEDDIYDMESIHFDELKCSFSKVKSIDAASAIIQKMNTMEKCVVSVKSETRFMPKMSDVLTQIENSQKFEHVYRVVCDNDMKYKPYGFFYELISSIYNYTKSSRYFEFNNLEVFNQIDEGGFIRHLINMIPREFPHPEDVRYSLFDIFFNIFYSMSKTLIYIENFEKIDDSSKEVLGFILNKFSSLDVSYLIVSNKQCSLQRQYHFLLPLPFYSEITIKPTPTKEIIENRIHALKPILESHYLEKIIKNTRGSLFYFNQALSFLTESELIKLEKTGYIVSKFENILIPPNLDDLIAKRIKFLSKDATLYKLFAMLILIGPRVDFLTLSKLEIPNDVSELQKLIAKEYLLVSNNILYFQNYELLKKNFLSTADTSFVKEIALELLQKIYSSETPTANSAMLYNLLENEKHEFLAWEKLSKLNNSLGDFSAYLHCSLKFLKLLDNHIDESAQKTIDEYKLEVYENLSNFLYKYTPDRILNLAPMLMENIEKSNDDKKIISLSNKMLQGCLLSGNYTQALTLTHKILSKMPNSSADPSNSSFSISYFLIKLIKIEIAFSIGEFRECIDAGEELLNIITQNNISLLKPEYFTIQQFEELLFDSMAFAAVSKIIMMDSDLNVFCTKLENKMGKLPQYYSYIGLLEKTLKNSSVEGIIKPKSDDDKFSMIFYDFVKAFNTDKFDMKKFAGDIYQAKISARIHNLRQFELVCDLLIGYSYSKLNKIEKASIIYYNALDISTKNGLKGVVYIAWYLITLLKYQQNEFDIAYGIANNAIIQLEKDSNSSNFLLLIFKKAMYDIYIAQNDEKSAELCLRQANLICEKHGLSPVMSIENENVKELT